MDRHGSENRLLSLADASTDVCDSSQAIPDDATNPCTVPAASGNQTVQMGRRLPWLDSALDYTFNVELTRPAPNQSSDSTLTVRAELSKDVALSNDVLLCRFEPLSFWNKLIAVSRFWRLVWAAAFLMALAVIARLIGFWSGETKNE
jgi:hypothetical protein